MGKIICKLTEKNFKKTKYFSISKNQGVDSESTMGGE